MESTVDMKKGGEKKKRDNFEVGFERSFMSLGREVGLE